jgi:hypothetical protein
VVQGARPIIPPPGRIELWPHDRRAVFHDYPRAGARGVFDAGRVTVGEEARRWCYAREMVGCRAFLAVAFAACAVSCGGDSKRSGRDAEEPSSGGSSSGGTGNEAGMRVAGGTNAAGSAGDSTNGGVSGTSGSAVGGASGSSTGGTSGSAAGGAGGSAAGGASGSAAGGAGSGGMAGGAGSGGMAGAGGMSGSGGSGGVSCTDGECWDGVRCETTLDAIGCSAMYAQEPTFPLPELSGDCTGATDSGYLYASTSDTTTLLCAYGFGPLVYGVRRDDSPRHCGGRSFEVSAGKAPSDLRLVYYHAFRGCRGVAEHSRAPLFDELFPEERPEGACVSAHDDCRGRASLLVCSPNSQCVGCNSDAECLAEYPYFGDGVFCRYGICNVSWVLGSCLQQSASQDCRTATDGFVCVARRCAHCETDEDCLTVGGTCRDGACTG